MITNDQINALNITRIVYNRGVAIRLNADGFWQFESQQVNLPLIQADNATIQQEYNLQPVMVTTEQPPGNKIDMLLSNRPNHHRFLDIERTEAYRQMNELHGTIRLVKILNQDYITGALIHHCKRMAESYCKVSLAAANSPGGALINQEHLYSSHPEPYYELDAWLSVASRAYDTSRYILWDAFGGTGSIPSSFNGVLKKAQGIPNTLRQKLEQSWVSYGEKIKAYRDCIHHYSPLDFGMSTARANALAGLVWSIQMHIPDNPEARSKAEFQFKNQIDALDFAWAGTVELVNLPSEIVKAIA